MVCDKCQVKLRSLATPDVKKKDDKSSSSAAASSTAARSSTSAASSGAATSTTSGGRAPRDRIAGSTRDKPYDTSASCRICHQQLNTAGMNFCQTCAYTKGICSMCGRKQLDVSKYNQSNK